MCHLKMNVCEILSPLDHVLIKNLIKKRVLKRMDERIKELWVWKKEE